MIITFYGLPLDLLVEKLVDFNFTEVKFHTQYHGDIY